MDISHPRPVFARFCLILTAPLLIAGLLLAAENSKPGKPGGKGAKAKAAAKNGNSKPGGAKSTEAKATEGMEEKGDKALAKTFVPSPLTHPLKSPSEITTSSKDVAAKIDAAILKELNAQNQQPTAIANDEEFIRRVSLDLVGKLPHSSDVTLFCLDSDPEKRIKLVDKLLASPDFSHNWAMYWREVFLSRATEQRARLMQADFEDWLTDQFDQKRPWDAIVTDLLIATGDTEENASTALIFMHSGEPEEIAAEASRIFLGIQIQCANCHDHPTDRWKREQFHQLAAFFPRVTMKPKRDQGPRSYEIGSFTADMENRGRNRIKELLEDPEKLMKMADRNGDKKLSAEELSPRQKNQGGSGGAGPLAKRLLEQADKDKDGFLTLKELKDFPIPAERPGAGSLEHYMPDLKHPQEKGTKMQPVFFVDNQHSSLELSDVARRHKLAEYITSPRNPWFAKAFVNRVWSEMLGRGFYMPIDDMGPDRTPEHPKALEALSQGFSDNYYDIRWAYRTIALTQTYQRGMQKKSGGDEKVLFAAINPTHLRSDSLYDAMIEVLGVKSEPRVEKGIRGVGAGARYNNRSFRGQFNQLFGFDPSTPQDEIVGTVPQALFMMNNPVVNQHLNGQRGTHLARILEKFSKDDDAVRELYLHVLAREPHEKELATSLAFVKEVNNRTEAFEDLYWGLLNSAEFQTKR